MPRIREHTISDKDWQEYLVLVQLDPEIPGYAKATFAVLHSLCDENRRVTVHSSQAYKITGGKCEKTFRNHLNVLRKLNLICSMKTKHGALIEFYSPHIRYCRIHRKNGYAVEPNGWITTEMAQYMHMTGLLPKDLKNTPAELQSQYAMTESLKRYATEAVERELDEFGYSHMPDRKLPGIFNFVHYKSPRKVLCRDNTYITKNDIWVYSPRKNTVEKITPPDTVRITQRVFDSVLPESLSGDMDTSSYALGYRMGASDAYGRSWAFIDEEIRPYLPNPKMALFQPSYPKRYSFVNPDQESHIFGLNTSEDANRDDYTSEEYDTFKQQFKDKLGSYQNTNSDVYEFNMTDPVDSGACSDQDPFFVTPLLVEKLPIYMLSSNNDNISYNSSSNDIYIHIFHNNCRGVAAPADKGNYYIIKETDGSLRNKELYTDSDNTDTNGINAISDNISNKSVKDECFSHILSVFDGSCIFTEDPGFGIDRPAAPKSDQIGQDSGTANVCKTSRELPDWVDSTGFVSKKPRKGTGKASGSLLVDESFTQSTLGTPRHNGGSPRAFAREIAKLRKRNPYLTPEWEYNNFTKQNTRHYPAGFVPHGAQEMIGNKERQEKAHEEFDLRVHDYRRDCDIYERKLKFIRERIAECKKDGKVIDNPGIRAKYKMYSKKLTELKKPYLGFYGLPSTYSDTTYQNCVDQIYRTYYESSIRSYTPKEFYSEDNDIDEQRPRR